MELRPWWRSLTPLVGVKKKYLKERAARRGVRAPGKFSDQRQDLRMTLRRNALFCLLLAASSVCLAEKRGTRAAASSNRTLQPWLVGLSAVLGFLCVVFILLMVKRLCFEKDRNEELDGDLAPEEQYEDIKQNDF